MHQLISFLFIVSFISACGKGEIPVITNNAGNTVVKVPSSLYLDIIEEGVDKSLPHAIQNEETYEVDTITMGLSLDAKAGVGPLSVGGNTAIDFYFKEAE